MTTPEFIVTEQAELLQELVERVLAGQWWTVDMRKDARILVELLCEHSREAEFAGQSNTLERKLWDDTEP